MKNRCWIVVLLLTGLLGAAPAAADTPRGEPLEAFPDQLESLLGPEAILGGVVSREDIDLVLAHVRASLLAAMRGGEAPSAGALERRAEEIANALRARGTLAALLLLDALEAEARRRVPDVVPRSAPPPAGAQTLRL